MYMEEHIVILFLGAGLHNSELSGKLVRFRPLVLVIAMVPLMSVFVSNILLGFVPMVPWNLLAVPTLGALWTGRGAQSS